MTADAHTGALTLYRFFVVDEFDVVAGVQWIECANDATAEETGVSLLSSSCDVEVWDVGRLVCKCSRTGGRDTTN